MQTHLSRRGKRLTQLFLHADRDRSGNLDADEIRSLLVSANLPGELTTSFMAQLDKDNSGTVSMDEFSRALSNNGYAGGRDSGPKVGKIDRAMWASSAFLTAEEHARQDAKAAQREKKPSEAERRRARTKHGAWAYLDPERPDEIKPDTGKTFSERPYYTCDRQVRRAPRVPRPSRAGVRAAARRHRRHRAASAAHAPPPPLSAQVHAWQNYHAQPNPVTLNRAHPAFPEAGPLMTRTNYTIMHGREGGGGGRPATATASPVVTTTKPRRERPQSATQANLPPASRPADPPKARPASAAAAKLSTFCDVDRYAATLARLLRRLCLRLHRRLRRLLHRPRLRHRLHRLHRLQHLQHLHFTGTMTCAWASEMCSPASRARAGTTWCPTRRCGPASSRAARSPPPTAYTPTPARPRSATLLRSPPPVRASPPRASGLHPTPRPPRPSLPPKPALPTGARFLGQA